MRMRNRRRVSRDDGRVWGTAVHRCIDAMIRGRKRDSLRMFASAVLDEERLPPTLLDTLMRLLDGVAQSPAWKAIGDGSIARSELSVMRAEQVGDRVVVTEGVIDLAIDDGASWRVIDWKTDRDAAAWSARIEGRTDQVLGYTSLLTAITGRPATGQLEHVISADDATT